MGETTVETRRTPSFAPVFVTGVLLAVIGIAGISILVIYTRPTLAPRWLFFFLGVLAVTGLALPLVYFFNRRFPSKPPADGAVLLRQALWVGIYVDLLAWLQLGRVISLALIIFILAGLVGIEFLIRLRERSRFRFEKEEHE